MSLQEQHIAFKFMGGVETKMDSKAVPSARLLVLENGVFGKAISIKKRNGYAALSTAIDGTASLMSGAKKLATRDDELLQFTTNRCYSRNASSGQWVDAGVVISASGSDRPAVHTGSAQTSPDHATLAGTTAYVWEDSLGGVWWTTEDTATGAIHRAPTRADDVTNVGQRPRCVAVGDAIHIYYAAPSSGNLMVLVINPSSPSAAVSATVLTGDLHTTNPVYDVCPTSRAGTPALLAWQEAATSNIRFGYVTPSGTLGSPASGYPSIARVTAAVDAASPLACAFYYSDGANADRIVLAYTSTTAGNGCVRTLNAGDVSNPIGSTVDALDTAYVTPATVTRIALATTDTSAWVAYEEYSATTSKRFCVVNNVILGGAVGTETTIRSVGLASRAFQAGAATDAFAVFVHDTTYFNTYLTLRLSDFAPAGRHLAAQASGAPARSHLPSVHVTSGVAVVTLPQKTRLASANNDQFAETALRQVSLDFNDTNSHQTAQIGRGLYMASACPQHYDGLLWTEHGFHVGPELVLGVPDAVAGSMTSSATYEYVVWYEWTDAQGEVHRGPTSVNTTVITGAADTRVTLTLPTLRVTRKSNVRICVGRTLSGDATRLWRVSSLDPTVSGANGYIANTTSSDTVTFVDQMSDINLALQEPIYTTGGILSNDPVTPGNLLASGKNRIFFSDASEPNLVRFSQRIAPGYGMEMPPELALDVDPLGGAITALAIMDDVVYVFKQSCIHAFNGDGPLENGSTAVSGFSASQLVTSDAGCTDPASIVLTPKGLMFKSGDKGIFLLDRSRQVSYVGAPVEGFNSQDVTRANVMPDRTQVVFLTSSGSTLLFDYLFEQWSTFSNHEGLDAVVASGVYHYLRTNDVVYQETVGAYLDGTQRITLRLETAWLHLYEHLQGFQRFWKLLLLGTWVSAHQLGIQYRTSYDEAWSDPDWLDATGNTSGAGWLSGTGVSTVGVDPITGSVYGDSTYGTGVYGGTGPDVYQWRMGIHENGQSIQFRFEDFEKAGLAGASFELTEMTIIGGVKKLDTRPFSGARST